MKFQQFIYQKLIGLLYASLGLILAINSLNAQQIVVVTEHTDMVGKISRTGLKTSIGYSEKKVADAWKSYLNSFGKVSASKGIFEVEVAKITAISPQPIRIMSKVVEESNSNAYVFCSFDVGNVYITTKDSRYDAAEKFLKDFVIKMSRDDYSQQVSAAEKTLNESQKNQEKLLEKDRDWAKQVQNSEQDIIDMEKKINDKKVKIAELKSSIEANLITKRSAAEETETARKTLEQMRVKLGAIN
jgi:hypothetical protein